MQDFDIKMGIEEYYDNSSDACVEFVDDDVFYSDFQAWKNPPRLCNRIWIDKKVGTVIILDSVSIKTDEDYTEHEDIYFRLPPKAAIYAALSLGQVFYQRLEGETMYQFHCKVEKDVRDQISCEGSGWLDRDGIAIVTGDGTLTHLLAAGRLAKKVAQHLAKGGRPVRFHICGLDARRSKAYRWVAKKLGFLANRDEFYYTLNVES